MGLWIYFSGVLIAAAILLIRYYCIWSDGRDITVGDIFLSIFIYIFSWIGVLFLIGIFIEKHCNDVVIESKKQ